MQEVSIYAGLFFFMFLYSPLNSIISIGYNCLSRKNEYEADRFSVETYGNKEAFVEALKKLSVDNLSNLTPHPAKVLMEYTHPPVLARIRALGNADNTDKTD